jgi:hypothetical protein
MITLLIRSIHFHFNALFSCNLQFQGMATYVSILAMLEQYKFIICKQNIPALVFRIWCRDEQQQSVRVLVKFTGIF